MADSLADASFDSPNDPTRRANGSAGDELRAWIAGDLAHGVRDIGGARILELNHDRPIACWMAATMLV